MLHRSFGPSTGQTSNPEIHDDSFVRSSSFRMEEKPKISTSNDVQESYILKAVIAGTVCAVVSAFLNPFDVTKIRLQNQSKAGQDVGKKIYDGLFRSMLKIFKDEGFAGLAKGVQASMLREISYSSVRIGAYEPIRFVLSSNKDTTTTSPAIKFVSALISGGVGAAIANPFDLVKTRFQAHLPGQPPLYPSTAAAFSLIFRSEGVAGLYKGWPVTSARAAVLTSAQLGSYDTIKNNILVGFFGFENGLSLHLVASMSAGIITTTAANPVDVIKTRYMSDSFGKYSGPLNCVMSTFRDEGIQGFFKGWVPAYWRLGPHTVLSFLLIEKVREMLSLKPI